MNKVLREEITVDNIDDYIRQTKFPHYYWNKKEWDILLEFGRRNGFIPKDLNATHLIFFRGHHHKE